MACPRARSPSEVSRTSPRRDSVTSSRCVVDRGNPSSRARSASDMPPGRAASVVSSSIARSTACELLRLPLFPISSGIAIIYLRPRRDSWTRRLADACLLCAISFRAHGDRIDLDQVEAARERVLDTCFEAAAPRPAGRREASSPSEHRFATVNSPSSMTPGRPPTQQRSLAAGELLEHA